MPGCSPLRISRRASSPDPPPGGAGGRPCTASPSGHAAPSTSAGRGRPRTRRPRAEACPPAPSSAVVADGADALHSSLRASGTKRCCQIPGESAETGGFPGATRGQGIIAPGRFGVPLDEDLLSGPVVPTACGIPLEPLTLWRDQSPAREKVLVPAWMHRVTPWPMNHLWPYRSLTGGRTDYSSATRGLPGVIDSPEGG